MTLYNNVQSEYMLMNKNTSETLKLATEKQRLGWKKKSRLQNTFFRNHKEQQHSTTQREWNILI